MAGTFYKYAERNVESQINWAEVGKSVVDMLDEEVQLREEKKAAIDEATREQLNVIKNTPLGDNENLNNYMIGLSDDLTKTTLMQQRLLKSGQLNEKDYMISRQNMNDDLNLVFTTAETLQKNYKEAMDRYTKGESQETEVWLMEQVQGLAKFTGTKASVNPVTGMIDIAEMTKDPKTGQMVIGKNISIRELSNFANTRLDKFDYEKVVAANVESLGTDITSELTRLKGAYKLFELKTIEDITQRQALGDEGNEALKPYLAWEEGKVKSMLVNPYDMLSILTDRMEGYSPTFDKDEAAKDPSKIYMERSDSGKLNPVFTEEQRKAAEGFLKTNIRLSLDKKITKAAVTEPIPPQKSSTVQDAEYKTGKAKELTKDLIGDFALLYRGDASQRQQAANSIISKSGGKVKQVEVTDTGVVFTFKNNSTATRNFENMTEGQWVVGNVALAMPEEYEGERFDNNSLYKEAGGGDFNSTARGSGDVSSSIKSAPSLSDAMINVGVEKYGGIDNAAEDIFGGTDARGGEVFAGYDKVAKDKLDVFFSEVGLPAVVKIDDSYLSNDVDISIKIKKPDGSEGELKVIRLNGQTLAEGTPAARKAMLRKIIGDIDAIAKDNMTDTEYLSFMNTYISTNPAAQGDQAP